ncbi:hypothetical protein NEF87_000143 [Candidatus Lokiarchaeum ossiferum]|uniref:DUF3795 domain-containing protein n=1 Tax=Candidatus Lokiarchaeum ossiferum TaxID=2951803 RepID=A0ABY6HK23_9ARCH|nr:hypothetical protein NEF87_000143 [Candidatus Lokiarchaeum sp. B-35]
MNKKNIRETKIEELFCQCGMFCGLCTSYLSYKYQIPRRRGIISYCLGCRPRDKQCSWIKKKCEYPQKNEIKYCYECPNYPCSLIDKICDGYNSTGKYRFDFKENLKIIQNYGYEKAISYLKKDHSCEKCGEILCIHNNLCYNCDKDTLATMKNYKNDQ